MKAKRRRFDPEFKARVALEAIKGLKTIQQISKEFEIHPGQVTDWKKVMLGGAASLFQRGDGAPGDDQSEREREQLHAQIGRLAVSVEYLKKKCRQLGVSTE